MSVRWDPASLYRDERVMEAALEPCASYSLNSKLFVLRETSAQTLELVGRKSARKTSNVFLFFGVAALIGAVAIVMHTFFGALVTGALGAIFVWVARSSLRDLRRRRVFDKSEQLFVKDAAGDEPELRVPLADIAAVQLLKKRVESKQSASYECLELNLVLRDGARLNVVVDGGVQRLERDARTLAAFLGVPLWQADAAKPY